MKSLVSLLVTLLIASAIYYAYFKKAPTTDHGTAATQAISLTGVRMDLLQIAQAERTYFASNAKCVSLEELASSGTVNFARSGRDGYTYEVRCGDANEFSVVARHPGASTDSGVRYPTLAIDQNLQTGEVR